MLRGSSSWLAPGGSAAPWAILGLQTSHSQGWDLWQECVREGLSDVRVRSGQKCFFSVCAGCRTRCHPWLLPAELCRLHPEQEEQLCCVSEEHKSTLGQQPPSNSTRVLGFLRLPGHGDKQSSRKCLTPRSAAAWAWAGSSGAAPAVVGMSLGFASCFAEEGLSPSVAVVALEGAGGGAAPANIPVLAVTLQVTRAPRARLHTHPRKANWRW